MEMMTVILQMSVEYLSLGAVNNFVSTVDEFVAALRTIAVPVATLMLIVAGIMWFATGEQGPARAKKLIVGVVIGLVIIFAADAISNFVQTRSSF
ncbi:MAG TPA: pilin [Candidatus Dormibacteraeota bacterium]|nr:pilin [Candidatus Dormibacteraeota bacterium]